jgi:diadenosine tetraphosphate (Ap4A) HIT family hydrolase
MSDRNDAVCEFCDEFAGGRANSFSVNYEGELRDRTILDADGFRVLPSLGQIVAGYLLLVPNRHHRAFADMSGEELTAAEALKDALAGRMRAAYGSMLFFEHGIRTHDSGGCGISHAHLHLVPCSDGSEPLDQLAEEFPFEEISAFRDLRHVREGQSYLYYETNHSKKYVFYPPFIPSQYVRRLLGENLGNARWDWREAGREQALIDTVSRVSNLLSIVTP